MLQITDRKHRSRIDPVIRALFFSAFLMLTMGSPVVADDGLSKAASQKGAVQNSVTAEKQNVAQAKPPRKKQHRRKSLSRPRAHDTEQIEQESAKSHQRKGKRRGIAKREQRNRFRVSGSFELVLGDQIKLRGSGAVRLDLDQQTAKELVDTINKQLDQVIPLISDVLELLSELPKSMESVSKILNFLSPP
ncbi:hypothetical protein SH139x_002627 [Planctomycetaceae bacterium SH139]